MTLLTVYLLALIHMKIPIKIKIKHFQFSNSLLSQCFRLLLLFLHDRSSVNDRSWEMFMSVWSSWVAAGTGETSTLKKVIKNVILFFNGANRKGKFFIVVVVIACSFHPTHLSLLDSFFFAGRRLVDALELVAVADDHNPFLLGIFSPYPLFWI